MSASSVFVMSVDNTRPNDRVDAHFRFQAKACETLGSPFTSHLILSLLRCLNDDTALGHKVLNWPGDPVDDALALRLAAAFHSLHLHGRINALHKRERLSLDDILPRLIADHEPFIVDFIDHPPQTNEVARSAVLAPGFLSVAQAVNAPLDLLEIGSSAGLNQLWQHWYYQLGGKTFGDPKAPIALRPDWRGADPVIADIDIASIQGADIRPINLVHEEERLRLLSYIWPDQADRLQRLKVAIDVALKHGVDSREMDAGAFLDWALHRADPTRCQVVFHSIVWQYLPKTTKDSCLRAMKAAVERGIRVAWLRMEPAPTDKVAELRLDLLHEGKRAHLADCHFHGAWVHWYGGGEGAKNV